MKTKQRVTHIIGMVIGASAPFAASEIVSHTPSNTETPAFVTAARMASSYADAPNSLTKLDVLDLELLGIDTIVDALRLVPGMIVSDIHGSNAVVGYHGTNVNVPRRMDILFNANSLYRPGYSGLHWYRLPIEVDDLGHIEVVRGSSVTDFGSNAFTAAINFVQKSALMEPDGSVQHTQGSGDTRRTRLGHRYRWDNGHYLLRYSATRNNGFDTTVNRADYRDDSDGDSLLLSGEVQLPNRAVLDWTLAHSEFDYQVPDLAAVNAATDATRQALSSVLAGDDSEEQSTSAVVKLNGHTRLGERAIQWHGAYQYTRFQRDQRIDLCAFQFAFDPLLEQLDDSDNIQLSTVDLDLTLATGTPQFNNSIVGPLSVSDLQTLAGIGQKLNQFGFATVANPICGTTDQDVDETRQGLEFQTTAQLSDRALWSSALGYAYADARSQTYLDGTVKRHTLSFSNNLRYRWSTKGLVNLGTMMERNNDLGDTLISGRASINYQFHPAQSLRLTWSRSKRSPDIYETDRRWNYRVVYEPGATDYNGQTQATLFRNALSPDNLQAEAITSTELAYTLATARRNHTLDIKLFEEERDNLISEPFEYLDFALTNNGAVDLTGIEVGYQYRSRRWQGLRAGLGYLYLDRDTQTPEETTLYSRHSGHAWLVMPVREHTHLGLAYVGNTELATGNYSRVDITLTQGFTLAASEWQLQLNYRHYPRTIRSLTEFSPVSPNQVSYDNDDRVFLTLSVAI